MAAKESGKLFKARRRGYFRVQEVNTLTPYFLIKNGEDIRMVYNGTYKSGIPTLRYLWLDTLYVM